MTTLRAMGVGEPETFRCRVYGLDDDSIQERRRIALVRAMASDDGWIEGDGYDRAISALQERGWLPADGQLVPNPAGPGRVKVWRLTAVGRREFAEMMGEQS